MFRRTIVKGHGDRAWLLALCDELVLPDTLSYIFRSRNPMGNGVGVTATKATLTTLRVGAKGFARALQQLEGSTTSGTLLTQ